MSLTIIGSILGAVTSFVPSVIDYFNAKQKMEFEVRKYELESQRMELANKLQIDLTNAKADANEGDSLRTHDARISGGKFIDALRASVRPVITYLFFGVFVAIKYFAFSFAMDQGASSLEALQVVWDAETASVFAAILGFWFGGRMIERGYKFRVENDK